MGFVYIAMGEGEKTIVLRKDKKFIFNRGIFCRTNAYKKIRLILMHLLFFVLAVY